MVCEVEKRKLLEWIYSVEDEAVLAQIIALKEGVEREDRAAQLRSAILENGRKSDPGLQHIIREEMRGYGCVKDRIRMWQF